MSSAHLPPDEAAHLGQQDQLMARIGQDLSTPLHGIVAMTSMLMRTGLTDEQLRYARAIDHTSRSLTTLASEVVDFATLHAAGAKLERSPFSLPELIAEIIAAAQPRAEAKGLSLRHFIDEDLPIDLIGDAIRLRQLLATLLDTALDATATGEVRLDLRAEEAPTPSHAGIRFTVIDTGPGLTPETCSRFFEPFTPIPGAAAPGLRLAIARLIAQLMQGDLHIHSRLGQGATLWFTARFDLAASHTVNTPPEPAAESAALRILIAEDSAINQVILSEQVRTLGHACAIARNGVEALEALEASDWDAIFLDCQMPVMDGFETVEAIRRAEAADGANARRTWVVAVTASNGLEERDTCLNAGMDDFLTKPVSPQDLALAIARIPTPASDRLPIDPAQLSSLAEGTASTGQNLLDRMITLFTESGPEALDLIDQALRQDDLPAAARSAHKLAGSCSYFGASGLHTLCLDLERTANASDLTACRTVAPLLRQEYARVELALQRALPARSGIHS